MTVLKKYFNDQKKLDIFGPRHVKSFQTVEEGGKKSFQTVNKELQMLIV